MVILVIMVFIGVVLFDAPDLVRRKYWRELAAFSSLLLFAFLLTLLQSIGVLKPGLMEGMEYLIKDVLHIYYK